MSRHVINCRVESRFTIASVQKKIKNGKMGKKIRNGDRSRVSLFLSFLVFGFLVWAKFDGERTPVMTKSARRRGTRGEEFELNSREWGWEGEKGQVSLNWHEFIMTATQSSHVAVWEDADVA